MIVLGLSFELIVLDVAADFVTTKALAEQRNVSAEFNLGFRHQSKSYCLSHTQNHVQYCPSEVSNKHHHKRTAAKAILSAPQR